VGVYSVFAHCIALWVTSFSLSTPLASEDFSHARGGTDSTRNMTRLAPAFKELARIGGFESIFYLFNLLDFRVWGYPRGHEISHSLASHFFQGIGGIDTTYFPPNKI
jgi:hypothetical protein